MASQSSDLNSPIYFWNPDGTPGEFLSQWYEGPFHGPSTTMPPCPSNQSPISPSTPVTVFHTAEHFMMYHKALFFHDDDIAKEIMHPTNCRDPGKAKALGRKVKGFYATRWDTVKEEIVEEGNMWKFTRPVDEGKGVALKEKLLGTGERELVEASPFDRVWGIGFDEAHADGKRKEWGQNLLGKALVRVRRRVKESVEEGCRDGGEGRVEKEGEYSGEGVKGEKP